MADSTNLALENCTIEFTSGKTPLDIFGAGLFIQGDCAGLKIQDCKFSSQILPTFSSTTSTVTTNPPPVNLPPVNAPPIGATPTNPPPVSAPVAANPAGAASPAGVSAALQMLDLARTSLQEIAGTTTAAAAPVTSPPIASVVTVGCLAINQLGPDPTDASIDCQLGTASLRNSTFGNLTMAVYGVVHTDTLRLQDNQASQCVGGFWLQFAGSVGPTDGTSQQLFSRVSATTAGFAERFILDVVASTYPLPQDATVPVGRVGNTGPTSLFIIGNQVEPIPVTNYGSAALLILGNLPVLASPSGDTSVSLMISNNRLHSQSDPWAATALVLVPQQARCTIIGNQILHDVQTTGTFGPCASLWMVQESMSTKGPKLLSIVGNVMQGTCDLLQLANTDTTHGDWTTFNAIEANQ